MAAAAAAAAAAAPPPPPPRLLSFSLFLVLSCLLSFPSAPLAETDGQGFMSLSISQKGLDFVKDLLIQQAVSSLSSLSLPKIQKSLKIPFIGTVHASLTNTTLSSVNVSSSVIQPGESGVAIVASGGTVFLSTDWKYSYSTWLVPIDISDSGTADIRVEGMEVGLTLGMEDQGGTLKLSLLERSSYLQDIFITLNGGASWFYQGLVDAFEDQIRSVVEKAINKKLTEGIVKLDTLLQKLPKEVKVDNITSLNATFVNDPLLSNSSVQFEINGLFTANGDVSSPEHYIKNLHSLGFCKGPPEMLWISVDEAVFNSASDVYFKAGMMQWIVDKVPDQSLLNTASWKFIVPQLYKKYPNDDMLLSISLSSPPAIWITQDLIDATVSADIVIEVIDGGQIIPVACISVVVTATGSLEVSGNNLAGQAGLNDFTMDLKWSKVGNIHMHLIQISPTISPPSHFPPTLFPLPPQTPPTSPHPHSLQRHRRKIHIHRSSSSSIAPAPALKGSGFLSSIDRAIEDEEEYRKARSEINRKGVDVEGYLIEGISVGGHETCVIIPSLNAAFDIGRCPSRAVQQDFLFITHAHLDHIGGLPMYVATRGLYSLKPPTVFVPPCIKSDVEKLLEIHRSISQTDLAIDLVALDIGETYEIRNDIVVRPFKTHHVIPSQFFLGIHHLLSTKKAKEAVHSFAWDQDQETEAFWC